MISIRKDKHKTYLKLLLFVLVSIIVLFIGKQTYINIANKKKIEDLKSKIEIQKSSNNQIVKKTKEFEKKTKDLLASYPTTEELESKLKEIFKRMSILDYELTLLATKKICIDRHVLVTALDYKTQNAKKAGLGILNYLGTVKQSDKDQSIYYIDYIADKKVEVKAK